MNESFQTFWKVTHTSFDSVIEELIVTDVKKKKSKLALAHFSSMPS